ncbi:hypothetical protein KC19_6G038500 [Ceratodon purpureus]|uniref:Uncharacterized protein n=1 Tax=Ceratodon purpureus TaxID=3225 RepID=A0A8T0HA47_CERPU|nr:hypothetical protein KC19_6G038500 [Ceratodon purpureus]
MVNITRELCLLLTRGLLSSAQSVDRRIGLLFAQFTERILVIDSPSSWLNFAGGITMLESHG